MFALLPILLACQPEATKVAADTDAAFLPPGRGEDCFDGADDDDDGLVDCEDDECLGACWEDCSDGADNDADDLIDCLDDECIGSGPCGDAWTVQLTTNFQVFAFGDWTYSADPVAYAFAYLSIEGTPPVSTMNGFQCNVSLLFYTGWAYGLSYAGTDEEVDFIFDFGFTVGDSPYGGYYGYYGGMEDCPVTRVPTAQLGLSMDSTEIWRRADADTPWYLQYQSEGIDTYGGYGLTRLYDAEPLSPVQWSAAHSAL